MSPAGGAPPTVALLPWGNVIEEFLDSIGVSLDVFAREFTGSWMFRYVAALERAGIRTVLVCVTARARRPARLTHGPTGATIHLLPAGAVHRALRAKMRYPFGAEATSVRGAFGAPRGLKRLAWPMLGLAHELVLYTSTPIGPLRRLLREEGCRAMICQEYEYPRFDVCVALGRALGIPVFGTFQGGDYRRNHLEALSRPQAMRRCAGLIIGTGREITRVRRRYGVPQEKIAQIFNPIDVRLWGGGDRETARARLAITPDVPVVVWHGRVAMDPKGLDILLTAWDRIAAARPAGARRLLLLGTGPDAAQLRRRLAERAVDDVHWVNDFVHDQVEIRRYLVAADVYAFPSRHEGFPVAPLEAMAVGLPVVAADVQGISDIFQEGEESGGVIVPRGDADALATSLTRLLDDPDVRRDLGRKARARVETAFSLEAVGRDLRRFLGLGDPGARSRPPQSRPSSRS